MKSEIGQCVFVLYNRVWGKTQIDNRIRSRSWWEDRLSSLINHPTIVCECDWEPGIYNEDETMMTYPTRYEDEVVLSKF